MTLVLLESLVVRVGGLRLALPGENVVRTLQARPDDTELVSGTPCLRDGDRAVPLARLDTSPRSRSAGRANRTRVRRRRRRRGARGCVRRRFRGRGLGPPRQTARRLRSATPGDIRRGRGSRGRGRPGPGPGGAPGAGLRFRAGREGRVTAGDLLAFRAGGQRFAVPLDRVREAARPRRITPLPGAPASWSGVALVRGEALGVVDVAAAVGLPPSAPGPLPLVVVLHGCNHALLVDSIDGVEPFPTGHVMPPRPVEERSEGSSRRKGASSPCSTSTISGRGASHDRRSEVSARGPSRRPRLVRTLECGAGARESPGRRGGGPPRRAPEGRGLPRAGASRRFPRTPVQSAGRLGLRRSACRRRRRGAPRGGTRPPGEGRGGRSGRPARRPPAPFGRREDRRGDGSSRYLTGRRDGFRDRGGRPEGRRPERPGLAAPRPRTDGTEGGDLALCSPFSRKETSGCRSTPSRRWGASATPRSPPVSCLSSATTPSGRGRCTPLHAFGRPSQPSR